MKQIRLYNMIFPIWVLMFFPPVILITLLGNYVIDSLVLLGCFYVYKLKNKGFNLKIFYKGSIKKVWLCGFLADFIGAAILLLLNTYGDDLFGFSYELTSAISYDPFSVPLAFIIVLFAMLVSSYFIFVFNYKFALKKQIEEKRLRFKVALTIAIVTIPWTFLLPIKWFS